MTLKNGFLLEMATSALISRIGLVRAFIYINARTHTTIFSNFQVHRFSQKISLYLTLLCKNPNLSNFKPHVQGNGSPLQSFYLQLELSHGYVTRNSVYTRHIYSETTATDQNLCNTVKEHNNNDEGHNSLRNELNMICRLLSDYRESHHQLEEALDGCSLKVSQDLVEQALKRCCNLGVPAYRFFSWAGKQPGYKHSTDACNIMIDILGNFKRFDTIWDLLAQMKKEGLSITHKAFFIIMKRYARAQLPQDAMQTFRGMVDFGCKPGIEDLNSLLSALCKNKLASDARCFYEEVRDQYPPNMKTYTILMKSWGDVGDAAQAKRVIDEMVEHRCNPDVIVYNTLLRSLCKEGRLKEAYRIFDSMKVRGPAPDVFTYSIFIHSHCEADQIEEALKVLGRMKRYGFVPSFITYNALIRAFCRMDNVDDAYRLLDEMYLRGIQPDVCSYNIIQTVHCKHNHVKLAMRLLKRMGNDGCKPNLHTYNILIKMLINVGRFDRAVEVWNGMEKRGFCPAVTTYAAMIHGFCKKRKLEHACKYFEEMIDEGIPPYPCTCELLKNCLLQINERRTVQILEDKMRKSSSCSIQELADTMNLYPRRRRNSTSETNIWAEGIQGGNNNRQL